MGSLGFWEIFALAVLALMIFGPDRLPGMARSAGKTVAKFRAEANKTLGELKDAAGVDDDLRQLATDAKDLRSSLSDVGASTKRALSAATDPSAASETAATTAAGLPAPFDADAT